MGLLDAFDWANVPDDEAFRKLSQGLIAQEYQDRVLPDRRGRDYGIDASVRHADGSVTVSSFKFYDDFNDMLKALRKDAESAKGYREADRNTVSGQLWEGVERIQIWTNLKMSPQQIRKAECVFEQIGLKAKALNREALEQALEKHPSVKNRFASEVPQLLLTAEQFLDKRPKAFRDCYLPETPFIERAESIEAVRAQLSDPGRLIVVVKAPGGVGKTRFLLQVSSLIPERKFHYLNEPTGSVQKSRNEVYAARGDVFVFDEGSDALSLFGNLAAHLEQERGPDQHPKIVVAIRPSEERELRKVLHRITGGEDWDPVELKPIGDLGPLLTSWGYHGVQAFAIQKASGGNPMWATIAHKAIQKGFTLLGSTRSGFAEGYLALRLDGTKHRPILDRLAAVTPINVDNDSHVTFLSGENDADLAETRAALSELVNAGLIQKGGRMRKIVPDLIADYLLRSQLVGEDGSLTGKEKQLIQTCGPTLVGNVIRNLARVEAGEGLGFLGRLFAEETAEVSDMNNGKRMVALEILQPAAHVDPVGALAFVQAMLEHPRKEDEVEVPLFANVTTREVFRHESVLRNIPKFLETALLLPECAEETLLIFEDIALQEGPGPHMGEGAKEVFARVAGFKEGRLTGYAEALFSAIESRIEEVLGQESTEFVQRLSFLISGVQAFLCLRLDTFISSSSTIHHWSGTVFLSSEIRALRQRALRLLGLLAQHPEASVREIGTNTLASAYSSLADASAGSEEQERALDEEGRALNELSLRIIQEEESFRVLRPLVERVYLTLDYDRRRSNKDWAREAEGLLNRKPNFDLKARFFGPMRQRRGLITSSRRAEAKTLVKLPEPSFLDTLAAWLEDAGGMSGTLVRTVEQFGLDRPVKAKRMLMAEVEKGIQPSALPYAVALLGGVRAKLGPDIITEIHRRAVWPLAVVYKDFWWFATGQMPNALEDQAFLLDALRYSGEDRRAELIVGVSTVTDVQCDYLFTTYEALGGKDDQGKEWPWMVDGLAAVLARHPDAGGNRLGALLMRMASVPDFFVSRHQHYYHLHDLLFKAARHDPMFLPNLVSSRVDALIGTEDRRQIWPYHAQQFAFSDDLTREMRIDVLRPVVHRMLRSDEWWRLDCLTDLVRDMAGGDASLMGLVLEGELTFERGPQLIERAIDLMDRFGFNNATLDVYERLLQVSRKMPGANTRQLEDSILSFPERVRQHERQRRDPVGVLG